MRDDCDKISERPMVEAGEILRVGLVETDEVFRRFLLREVDPGVFEWLEETPIGVQAASVQEAEATS